MISMRRIRFHQVEYILIRIADNLFSLTNQSNVWRGRMDFSIHTCEDFRLFRFLTFPNCDMLLERPLINYQGMTEHLLGSRLSLFILRLSCSRRSVSKWTVPFFLSQSNHFFRVHPSIHWTLPRFSVNCSSTSAWTTGSREKEKKICPDSSRHLDKIELPRRLSWVQPR